MKPIAILGLALAVSTAAGLAVAQQASPTQQRSGQHDGKARLDTNQDGVIDRAEAAARPRLAANFDKLDSNHDGRLQATEHPQRDGHKGKGHKGKHRGNGSRSGGIARMDSNGDGRISREEVAAKPRFADKFVQIDTNRDGYLVRGEVTAWHERMRPQRQAEHSKRLEQRFAAADLNRDGKLSKVEVSEKLPRMEKSFAWMDGNRDGFLSREELRPRRR